MKELLKKLARRARLFLWAAIGLFAAMITTLICSPLLPFGVMYALVMGCTSGSIVLMVFYIVKYRCVCGNLRLLKQLDREDCGDDIDLTTSTFRSAKVHCGKQALFSRMPYALIPYDQVGWVSLRESKEGGIHCHLKSGQSIPILLSPSDALTLNARYIQPHNPDLLTGNTPDVKKAFLERYPEALQRSKDGKTIPGTVMVAVALLAAVVRLINQAPMDFGAVLVVALFLSGVIMLITGKNYTALRQRTVSLTLRIRRSRVINLISKAACILCGSCLVGIFLFGMMDAQVMLRPLGITWLVTAGCLFLSVFFKCGFFVDKNKPLLSLPTEELEDTSFIIKMAAKETQSAYAYAFYLTGGYGWEYMKESADYMLSADIQPLSLLQAGNLSQKQLTAAVKKNGNRCKDLPALQAEQSALTLGGFSQCLNQPVRLVWHNQSRVMELFLLIDDTDLAERYIETVLRRSFGTADTLKRAKPVQPIPPQPVRSEGSAIHINARAFLKWTHENPRAGMFEWEGVLPLTEKEPCITVYEDGDKTVTYRLQPEGDEDFSGKYFHTSVRLSVQGNPSIGLAPAMQLDGFISDTTEERKMTSKDVGYRMEGHFLAIGGRATAKRRELLRGRELVAKGLKYPGYTTPSNVRLVGVCPACGNSFCFHGYAFYMAQQDVAYSDDGLDCCVISQPDIDKDTWVYEQDGKTFRYYNSFGCPHCGEPYIDYKKFPEDKQFGESGCVHIGHTHYTAT